jgi:hypothetical protein
LGPRNRRSLFPHHRQNTPDLAATGKQYQEGQSRHAHRPTPARTLSGLGLQADTAFFLLPPPPPFPPCTHKVVPQVRGAEQKELCMHLPLSDICLVHIIGYPLLLSLSFKRHQISSFHLHAIFQPTNPTVSP